MSSCGELERYLDRQLAAADRLAFETHVHECAACRQQVDRCRAVEHRLQQWADHHSVEGPSPAQTQRLAEAALSRQQRSSTLGWPWLVGAAAAASTVGLAALLVTSVLRDEPQQTETSPVSEAASAQQTATLRVVTAQHARPLSGKQLEGARLEAGKEGHLVTHLHHQTIRGRLGVGARSRAVVQRVRADEMVLRLDHGALACDVGVASGARLQITAGPVAVRVVGTRFLVRWAPEGQRLNLAVDAGQVELVLQRGQAVELVRAGEEIEVVNGEVSQRQQLSSRQREQLGRALRESKEPSSAATKHLGSEGPEPATPSAKPPPGRRIAKPRAPGDVESWRRWVAQGRLSQARAALRSYLRQVPRDAEAWSLLGDAQRKARNWRGALRAYRRVVHLAPPALANRARFLAATIEQDQLGRCGAASKLLQSYLRQPAAQRPLAAEAAVRRARCLLRLDRSSEAREALEHVLAHHRGSPAVFEAQELLRRLDDKPQP